MWISVSRRAFSRWSDEPGGGKVALALTQSLSFYHTLWGTGRLEEQSFQSRKPHAWKGPRSKGFWPEEGAWKYYSGTNKGEHGKEKQISVVAMWARPFFLERQPREVMPMSSRVGGASSAKLTSLSLLWSRCHGGSQVTCHLTQQSFIIEPRVSVQVS